MRIVSREELMRLPAGTVFSYYEPCVFNGLYIKSSEVNDKPDFYIQELIGAVKSDGGDFFDKCRLMEKGESLPVDFEIMSREGLFDDSLLYGIYEKEDIKKLIKILSKEGL